MLRLLGNNRYNLVRRRYGPGSRDSDGLWVPGTAVDTPIAVRSLQEHRGGRRREVRGDGTRRSDSRVLFCERGLLRVANDKVTPKVEADEVVDCDSGIVYKVVAAVDDAGLIPHQRCELQQVQEAP